MAVIPPIDEQQLRSICDVIGDTDEGLTNSEIDHLLGLVGIEDSAPGRASNVISIGAKRDRLFKVLRRRQDRDRCANNVVAFIKAAVAPVRYAQNPQRFQGFRDRLNPVLAFAGYQLGEDGELNPATIARTLDEAGERAGRLRSELRRRVVHPDVLRFCRAELLQDNYFHAVLEATKSVADKIRMRTGLLTDGNELIDQAFGHSQSRHPLLAFNTLLTPTDVSEHRGMMNLMKGLFGAFRNVTAHAPKVYWPIDEQDALDLLTIASMIHRRLDDASTTH